MKSFAGNRKTGFTLIEVIITIVALAVVAAMMANYFGTSLTQSSIPLTRLNSVNTLNGVIEKITAQYRQLPHWYPEKNYPANSVVLPTTPNANGFQYTAAGGGISGAKEPPWPVNNGVTVNDGSITWTQSGAAPTLTSLQTSIGAEGATPNNSFGNYKVIQNRFIKFNPVSNMDINIDSSPSEPAYGRFLKVIIAISSTGETRMALFVMR